jgi:hypothetical protein
MSQGFAVETALSRRTLPAQDLDVHRPEVIVEKDAIHIHLTITVRRRGRDEPNDEVEAGHQRRALPSAERTGRAALVPSPTSFVVPLRRSDPSGLNESGDEEEDGSQTVGAAGSKPGGCAVTTFHDAVLVKSAADDVKAGAAYPTTAFVWEAVAPIGVGSGGTHPTAASHARPKIQVPWTTRSGYNMKTPEFHPCCGVRADETHNPECRLKSTMPRHPGRVVLGARPSRKSAVKANCPAFWSCCGRALVEAVGAPQMYKIHPESENGCTQPAVVEAGQSLPSATAGRHHERLLSF